MIQKNCLLILASAFSLLCFANNSDASEMRLYDRNKELRKENRQRQQKKKSECSKTSCSLPVSEENVPEGDKKSPEKAH